MTSADVAETGSQAGPTSARHEHQERREILAHAAVLSALLFLLYRGVLPDIGTRVWGGGMDPPLVLMQFKWVADFILGRAPSYIRSVFSFPIYYPYNNAFALSDTLFGNQPFWFPVYAISGNPILATNIWIILCHILNYAAFSYYVGNSSLLGRTSAQKRRAIAVLCGALFAFTSARIDQHVHLQLLPHFWTPLALLALDRASSRPRWHTFALLSGAVAMQWFAGVHLAIMLTLLVIPLASAYCAASPEHRLRRATGLGASGVLAFCLVTPDLMPRLAAVRLGLAFNEQWVIDAAPGFRGFVRTVGWEGLARSLGIAKGALCHQALFPGIAMFLLLVASLGSLVVRPRRPASSWLCAGVLLVFYSLAVGHHKAVRVLPLYHLFREPARFALGALVPGLLLVAESLAAILTTRGVRVAVVAALALLMGETGARRIRAGNYNAEPDHAFEEVLRLSTHRPVMLLPQSVDTPNNPSRANMSQRQMELLSHSWVPGLAGRSGPRPPFVDGVTSQSLRLLTPSPDVAAFVARVKRLGYVAVVVMPHATHTAYCRALSTVLGPGRPVAGGYRYFGLHASPADAPGPAELDMGRQLARTISERSFSVRAGGTPGKGLVVEVLPDAELRGVVQRRTSLRVRFALLSGRRAEIAGDAWIILNRAVDRPVLRCVLPIPTALAEWRFSAGRDTMAVPPSWGLGVTLQR